MRTEMSKVRKVVNKKRKLLVITGNTNRNMMKMEGTVMNKMIKPFNKQTKSIIKQGSGKNEER